MMQQKCVCVCVWEGKEERKKERSMWNGWDGMGTGR